MLFDVIDLDKFIEDIKYYKLIMDLPVCVFGGKVKVSVKVILWEALHIYDKVM